MADATNRQKQFLRQLGHKSVDGLTKERASALIDELLQAERVSGKTFPCPYCKKPFGPRPRRTKKCPSCGHTIIHLSGKYPREWLDRVPAVVFACLIPGELRIILHPGVGLAEGGAPRDVPMSLVPFRLRMPNTPLWVQLDDDMSIVRVWRRKD